MDCVDIRLLNVNESPLTEQDLELCESQGETRKWPRTPFPIDAALNKRVILYDGDIALLRAEAIVNPTNDDLTQLELVSKLAGPDLESYIKKRGRSCPTSQVRLTPGFNSNFQHIIHAVPPKYQVKYQTAAETALFHTYFRIIETMIERRIRTLVMPPLTTSKCNIPTEVTCHMQLRVIRRILEKKRTDIDRIVILVNKCDQYTVPFFCYFPTSSVDEKMACYKLTDIGGPNGEPVIPEREIRIKSKPANDQSIDLTSGLDLSTVVGKTAFSKMRDDLDKQYSGLNGLKRGSSYDNNNQIAIRKTVFRGCTLL